MSTSLAEQLQRLARPQTSALDRGKKRASLLFDPKEAAGLRKETVFEIGLNGLQELILRNNEFEVFTNTLFSLDSRDFERSIESMDSNKMLNKHIKKFLLLLSPYFLLNCTYKALEWMIYKYSIHEYNKEDLLMLVLPYHESNIFVRVIQILKIGDEKDPWFFLKSLQKPGIHLAKQTLLNHAASNPHFIQSISTFIVGIVKVHKNPSSLTVAFNFYCSIFTGAIDSCEEVAEPMISQMLPALMKGLNSEIDDFRAGSYVILAKLFTKCTLSEIILNKFMEKIAEHGAENLQEEVILLYILLYQTQGSYKEIPDNALEEIVSQDWLPEILQNVNNEGCFIYPFLEVLVTALIKHGSKEDGKHYREYLVKLLDKLRIHGGNVSVCIDAVLDSIPNKLKKKSEEVQSWITDVIEKFEKQYPTEFDKHVYHILVTTENEQRRSKMQKVLRNALNLKTKFDVFEKLYHPNALIRTEAVKFVSRNYDKMRKVEKDILEISIEGRLRDDNIEVVSEALAIVKSTRLISDVKLENILIEILCKCYSDLRVWEKVLQQLIDILCTSDHCQNLEIILNIFPLLLPSRNKEMIHAKHVLKSELFSKCPLFHHFDREIDIDNAYIFSETILQSLNSVEDIEYFKYLLDQLKEINAENLSPLQKYMITIMFCYLLPENTPIGEVLSLLGIIEKLYHISPLKCFKLTSTISENFSVCKQGKLPVSGFLDCLLKLIQKSRTHLGGKIDFSDESNDKKLFCSVSSILYHNAEINFRYIDEFHGFIFDNFAEKLNTLLQLIVQKKSEGEENFDFLHILHRELKTETRYDEIISLSSQSIPLLFVLMTSPSEEFRKKVFEVTEIIFKFTAECKTSYYTLIGNVLNYQNEITLDSAQLPVAISNSLDSDKSSKVILDKLVDFSCDTEIPVYLMTEFSNLISNVNTMEVFEKTSVGALNIFNKQYETFSKSESIVIMNNIRRFNSAIGKDIKKGTNVMKLLESIVKNDKKCLIVHNDETSPSLLFLDHIDEQFISSLVEEVEFSLLDMIIEVSVNSVDPKVLLASNKIFKHVDLNLKQVLPQLHEMKNIYIQNQFTSKRKRSVCMLPTTEVLDTIEWKKGLRVLELIQDKKKLTNIEIVIPTLFDILKKCLDFDEQSAVEYPKQLILSSILHCCKKLNGENIPENVFNMELVVQCIRASSNPQTHHHALLVLAYCASFIPTQVLHHIMAIFTFIGSSVLRHDDAYSFQLIANIIDTVIPILVDEDNVGTLISVLRVFVDALLDVPEHRRMSLYIQLLERTNPTKHLHIFLLLVFFSHVIHSNQDRTKNPKCRFDNPSTNKRLDIASSLLEKFSPTVIFSTLINLLQYLRMLPIEQIDSTEKKLTPLDPSELTPKQFRHLKYTIILFMNTVVSSKEFVNKIASLQDEQLHNLEPHFKEIIVNIISFIQRTNPILDKYSNTNQAQYWKAIQHQNLEFLDGVNALLTTDMFLLVIKGLMSHNLPNIKKRALDLLNSKLQSNCSFIEEDRQDQLSALLIPLLSLIEKLNTNEEEEEHVIIQTALLSLKLIVKHVGTKDPEKYVPILEFVTNLIKSVKAQGNVLASSILCLAELCVILRARAIQCIPGFMPTLLKILKQQKHQESPTLLCLSLLTVILKVVECLSSFLSPYLKKLLTELSQLSCKWESTCEDPKLSPLIHKLTIIKRKLGEMITPRVFIPAIEESFNELVEKNKFSAIGPLMDILSENLKNMSGPVVTCHNPDLTRFFINALEIRNGGKCEIYKTNIIENQIIEALSALVLKLSETSFRPLYYKIYDWGVSSEMKNERIITFYNVSSGLAKHLKSLFVLFAGHFIQNAAHILDACNRTKSETLYFTDEDKNILLLEKVIETLLFVFKYTTMKFINKERFEILMQPLIDNLENEVGGVEKLITRNNELLTPCIVQFAIATADDALWKQMNYQILLKMRHSIPQIRLISLKCLTELVKQLGEDFLPLLPETIPFLSELLEDENEDVEKNCKKAIQEMEKILGENLQKYF